MNDLLREFLPIVILTMLAGGLGLLLLLSIQALLTILLLLLQHHLCSGDGW